MANKKVSQLTSKPSVLVTDLFPIADPSTGQLYKTTISDLGTAIGSGVSSVNGLVGAVVLDTDDIQELVSPTNKWFTDTRARAALSASSPLAYNSGTGVFSIPAATSSQNGYLTSTDWTTFNSKQAALSGTGFVKISGTTISYDNSTYLTTSAAASTYLALAGGTLTGALIGTSAGFTGYVGIGNTSPLYQLDVTGSGRFDGDLIVRSTNPRIYLTDTDNNPDYFISNTDGTFTVYDVTNSTSRFTIGITGNATFTNAIIRGGSITGTALYSTGIISAGTSLSVGTTITAGSSITATRLILSGGTSPTGLYFGHTDKVVLANYTTGGGIDFETNAGNITMQLSSGGVLSTTGGANFTGGFTGFQYNSAGAYPAYNTYFGAIGTNFSNANSELDIWNTVGGGFVFRKQTGASAQTALLTIASSGAATFSSSATAMKLVVDGASNGNVSQFALTRTDSSWGIFNETDLRFYQSNSNTSSPTNVRMVLNAGGYLGINTTNPARNIDINGNIRVQGGAIDLSNDFNNQIYSLSNAFYIKTNGSERLTITTGGYTWATNSTNSGSSANHQFNNSANGNTIINFYHQGTDPYGLFTHFTGSAPNNTTNYFAYFRDTSGPKCIIFSNGNIQNSNNSYGAISDIKLKENITDASSKLTDLLKVKIRNYNLIGDTNKQIGVIAQELEDVFPSLIEETEDRDNNGYLIGTKTKSVKYSVFVPMLIKAVQELSDKITTLENK